MKYKAWPEGMSDADKRKAIDADVKANRRRYRANERAEAWRGFWIKAPLVAAAIGVLIYLIAR